VQKCKCECASIEYGVLSIGGWHRFGWRVAASGGGWRAADSHPDLVKNNYLMPSNLWHRGHLSRFEASHQIRHDDIFFRRESCIPNY
jgi:hypothetical protein